MKKNQDGILLTDLEMETLLEEINAIKKSYDTRFNQLTTSEIVSEFGSISLSTSPDLSISSPSPTISLIPNRKSDSNPKKSSPLDKNTSKSENNSSIQSKHNAENIEQLRVLKILGDEKILSGKNNANNVYLILYTVYLEVSGIKYQLGILEPSRLIKYAMTHYLGDKIKMEIILTVRGSTSQGLAITLIFES